ncbi:MAG TPA: dihydropteroate synthase [Terriglobales bacterium]|nr:dihydropteroate synthase [Terriglobales bacterium]
MPVGGSHPVAIMGALNVSPESFYAGSVHRDRDALVRAGVAMARAGAVIVDVGARSTAPYRETDIGEREEAERLAVAVETLVTKVGLPVSADTARLGPARAALDAGAVIVNDVTALADPELARLAAARGASLLLMASPAALEARPRHAEPVAAVEAILTVALARARAAGAPDNHVVLDPGVGFFRDEAVAWDVWDTQVLARLDALLALGRPLCIGVSRKSFLGAITGRPDPAERLPASIAATALAVAGGAAVIRTHDVAETLDAVRVAECLVAARTAGRAR